LLIVILMNQSFAKSSLQVKRSRSYALFIFAGISFLLENKQSKFTIKILCNLNLFFWLNLFASLFDL